MLQVIVLGAAAGGGVPQWNCGCRNCVSARGPIASPAHSSQTGRHADARALDTSPSTQASIAVSVDGVHWFLVNAAPDLRQQISATPQLHPATGQLRHTPIAGVILTNGEVDAITGLLSMREGSPFTLYAHDKVLGILRDNSIFNVLGAPKVQRVSISIDRPFEPQLPDGTASGLVVTAFTVPGKVALFLEAQTNRSATEEAGDTLGLRLEDKASGQYFYFIAACARVTPELKTRLANAPLVFFDGTVWRDDELIAAGLGAKTGQDMGHIAMSGEQGAIAQLASLGIGRKMFLHINNSNPVLRHDSAERAAVEAAGWQIPADGMEISL